MFISTSDIELALDSDLVQSYFTNEQKLRHFENVAISEAKGYLLAANVNTDLVFSLPNEFVYEQYYNKGNFVLYNGQSFVCLQDNTVYKYPSQGEGFWALQDSRHPYLVSVLVNIMIYHAALPITVTDISDARSMAYKNAIKWLESVASGRVQLSTLPKTDSTSPTMPFLGGQKLNPTYF